MSPTLYLIRHAETEHNIKARYHITNPALIPLGRTQFWNLRKTFPHHLTVDLLLSSPYHRAIETTIIAFGNTLSRSDVHYLPVPDAQENSGNYSGVGLPLYALKNNEIPRLFKDSGLSFGAEKIE